MRAQRSCIPRLVRQTGARDPPSPGGPALAAPPRQRYRVPMWPISLALVTALSVSSTDPLDTARDGLEVRTRGDPAAALALVDDPSEADRFVVQASAASEGGLRRLEELARARFGEGGDLGVAARHRRMMQAVAKATVEIHLDRAVVRPEGERPVRLRRVALAWKVESPADRLTGDERRALEHALRKTVAATKDLGARIRSGALKNAREAREALRRAFDADQKEGVPL